MIDVAIDDEDIKAAVDLIDQSLMALADALILLRVDLTDANFALSTLDELKGSAKLILIKGGKNRDSLSE